MVAFNLKKDNYNIFKSIKDLKEYTIIEKANTEFIPIKNYLDNNSLFIDDTYFGSKQSWITFNEEGFIQFCRKFNIPYKFI